jgi:phenylacetate-CoA ligase
MTFFRLRTLPGYTWPALPDAAVSPIWATYHELQRTQWLTPEEIERGQLQQVRSLLNHCMANVPYYRRMLDTAGIEPDDIQSMADLRRIPILTRRTCQEEHEALTATRLPPGTVATGTASTSGTLGEPIKVLQTKRVDLWWCACYLRDLEWCGFDTSGSVAAIRNLVRNPADPRQKLEGLSSPCWLAEIQGLIDTGPAFGMDVHADSQRQLQWLRRVRPNYLLSYPSNLEALAAVVAEDGAGLPGLRAVHAIAEALLDETRLRIEAAFGVPVKNTYSCCEAGYLASPCPDGHGFHVHAENALLEVLDEAGQPCVPGQSGRVVLTTLHNLRGPFIRYQIGDEAVLAPTPCPCGRGLPLLQSVSGKRRPMFHLSDGRLKRSSALATMLRALGGHYQHQVIQKAIDHVIVRLVVDATWSADHLARLHRNMHEFFEGPIRVEVEIKERLELPPGGKLQSLVCEIAAG